LRDGEAELEQLTMDTRSAPERIIRAHAPHEITQFAIHLGVKGGDKMCRMAA
jgi:hypothetical protein